MTADAHAMTATPATSAHPAPHAAASGHAQRGISNPILGMLLFITSEVMFFSGLFAAYFATRAANQPWPPEPFKHILDPLGPIMLATVLLIRNMNARLRRLPDRFPDQEADEASRTEEKVLDPTDGEDRS